MADQNGGEAGADALCGEGFNFFSNFLLDGGGDGGAVEDFWHSSLPESSYRFRAGGGLPV